MYFVCCKILGVKPGSDQETIKAAYRKSAKQLHPDVNTSESAHEYFVILQNAYQYLIEHPHSQEEAKLLRRSEYLRRNARDKKTPGKREYVSNPVTERYTLREVLKNSITARILFVIFHMLFLIIGFYLIIRSVYDFFYYTLEDRTNIISAYLTIVFGFVFGLVITAIFLFSGYVHIRNR